MAVNTRKITGRPKLRFHSLDEMIMYVERLVPGGTRQLGNWSLGQNLQYLALIQIASIDGFPSLWSPPVRFLMKTIFMRWLLRRGFPPSGPNAKTLRPEAIEATEALANLRTATYRVRNETKRSLHPVFGRMSLDEWNSLYLRHAELHLSFCVPLGECADFRPKQQASA